MIKCNANRVRLNGAQLLTCLHDATRVVTATVGNVGVEIPLCDSCSAQIELSALTTTSSQPIPSSFYY
jgi:hypothetical protein